MVSSPLASQVRWSNGASGTVGVLGPVRIVVRGPPRVPPGLPRLPEFDWADRRPVLRVYASLDDVPAGRCAVEVSVEGLGEAQGHFMDVGGRTAVVRVLQPGRGLFRPRRTRHHSLEAALDAALEAVVALGVRLA